MSRASERSPLPAPAPDSAMGRILVLVAPGPAAAAPLESLASDDPPEANSQRRVVASPEPEARIGRRGCHAHADAILECPLSLITSAEAASNSPNPPPSNSAAYGSKIRRLLLALHLCGCVAEKELLHMVSVPSSFICASISANWSPFCTNEIRAPGLTLEPSMVAFDIRLSWPNENAEWMKPDSRRYLYTR